MAEENVHRATPLTVAGMSLTETLLQLLSIRAYSLNTLSLAQVSQLLCTQSASHVRRLRATVPNTNRPLAPGLTERNHP